MTRQPDRTALTAATQAARAALDTSGVADTARVWSRPVTDKGYPDGTILTEMQLRPHDDSERIIDALRELPRLVDLWSGNGSVVVVRSPTATIFGPGGRDGLTVREAVRQSRIIHPDWSSATHVDWLIEDGYPLDHMDRDTLEAMVTNWLVTSQDSWGSAGSAGAEPATAGADTGSTDRAETIIDRVQVPPPANRGNRLDATGLPQLPPGARLLSADEAIDLLNRGDHPDSGSGHGSGHRSGSVVIDAVLAEALRQGQIVGCVLANGQIAVTRAIPDTTGPDNPGDTAGPTTDPHSTIDE